MGRYDLICCGHLNLLPLAYLAKWKTGAPLAVLIYGIDAWQPPRSGLAGRIAAKVDAVISISDLTTRRFLGWAGVDELRCFCCPMPWSSSFTGWGRRTRSCCNAMA